MKRMIHDIAQSMLNRRAFVRVGATAAGAFMPMHSATEWGRDLLRGSTAVLQRDPEASADHAFMTAIAKRAVESATSAGATYAEARVTRQIVQSVTGEGASEQEMHGLSVRALVRGGWGFTAAPAWTDDIALSLGSDAARQATENAKAVPTPIELAPMAPATGTWSSPLKIDPLEVSIEEKMDLFRSVRFTMPYRSFTRMVTGGADKQLSTTRDEHVLVTSEGTSIVQQFSQVTLPLTTYAAVVNSAITDGSLPWDKSEGAVQGAGWETIRDYDYTTDLRKKAEAAYEGLTRKQNVSFTPLSPGRYTVVLGPGAMGQLLSRVVGLAMSLDRITLRSANTVGTSYLGDDPIALLQHYDFGSSLLSVAAVPWLTGPPTHRWDNEGVVPETVPLITQGILQDFTTTREQAAWLRDGYRKLGSPLRSHGYAQFGGWQAEPSAAIPTLVMTPAPHETSLLDLIGSVRHGYYIDSFMAGDLDSSIPSAALADPADSQLRQLTLSATPNGTQEIMNGRLGAHVARSAVLFNAVELWKSLRAIGGGASQAGGVVPALFTDLPLINPLARI